MQLIAGYDRAVADWAQVQFGGLFNFYAMHSAFGIADNGAMIGAALFSDYYPGGNVELTYYGPGTLTRSVLNALSYHAFVTLGVSRVTAKTHRPNKAVIRLLLKAGFQFECVQKRYYGPRDEDDAVVHVFPIEKATKWLRKVH